jgi:GTP-binding protein
VGKSTLFNRLVGFRKAMVHDRPGVTRDRLYEECEWHDRRVLLIDTGGLEANPDTTLLEGMRRQTLVAVEEADVIVFLVDAQAGWTPADDDVGKLLRMSGKRMVLVVNKVDGAKHEDLAADFYATGLFPLLTVSAEHGRGVYELMDEVHALLPDRDVEEDTPVVAVDGVDPEMDEGGGPIRIAVVGRPNIGKSTLINRLLGEDRHLVHDSPGTTMDPVDSAITIDGQDYVLVDTAGVRRKAKIGDHLERWISLRSIRAIERCHIVLFMMDGTEGPTDQDAKLIRLCQDRGRAMILLLNKWDLVPELEEVDSKSTEGELERKLPHAIWAPHLFISAKTGKGVRRIIPLVDKVYAEFDKRVSTSALNRFITMTVEHHTPPQKHHKPVRIYYATQHRVRPPTFVVFSNSPDAITVSYQRYLVRRMREEFGFEGCPIRLHLKKRRKVE